MNQTQINVFLYLKRNILLFLILFLFYISRLQVEERMSKQEHQVLFRALCGNSTGKILFLTLISNLTFRTTTLKAKNIIILPVLMSHSIQILNFFVHLWLSGNSLQSLLNNRYNSQQCDFFDWLLGKYHFSLKKWLSLTCTSYMCWSKS